MMSPSEGDTFPARAGAGWPHGEVTLQRLLMSSAPAAVTWVKSQVNGWERHLGL